MCDIASLKSLTMGMSHYHNEGVQTVFSGISLWVCQQNTQWSMQKISNQKLKSIQTAARQSQLLGGP